MSAAPPLARVLTQARFEAGTILRNGEQLLVTFILPLIVMVVLARTSLLGERSINDVMPAMLALAVMSSAFTSQAISTAFDRRSGVMRLLATTPLGRSGLVGGKVLAITTIVVAQVLVIGGLGVALGWRPYIRIGILWLILFLVLGTVAFASLGLWLAGTVRPEGVLAIANLIWVLLLLFGGILWPASELPIALRSVVQFLPSAALVEGLYGATWNELWLPSLYILAPWAVIGLIGATRSFRWE